jgi:hypothetical protein
MIDDPHREADALPTLRSRNWLFLGLLVISIGAWGVVGWLLKHMVDMAIAIGWPV